MAHQHVLDGVLLVESVVDVQHRAAGITPDILHAFGLECLDEDLRAAEFESLAGSGCGRGAQLRLRDFHDQPL
jgi:hypothetical protein